MNVWLEKSVCLISTLEWNNLPPPGFFGGFWGLWGWVWVLWWVVLVLLVLVVVVWLGGVGLGMRPSMMTPDRRAAS